MKRLEGIIDVLGGNVWYEVVGDNDAVPLIALHGGPGFPHDSLEPLVDLATDRKIVFYDQLGCGNSFRTHDRSLFTVERFVKELELVIKSLKLKKYHILGHSWGAALAVAFALSKSSGIDSGQARMTNSGGLARNSQQGLQSLILADPYISTPQWEKDAKRLLNTMPKHIQLALKKGDIKTKAYKEARNEYYYRHVYRFKKVPVAITRAHNKMNKDLYCYMWGPEEFDARGTLKNFDLVPRLSEIKIPVLLLCGGFDEATPEALEVYKSKLSNAQIKVFEKSAHMPQWTEREVYIATIRKFLQAI